MTSETSITGYLQRLLIVSIILIGGLKYFLNKFLNFSASSYFLPLAKPSMTGSVPKSEPEI